MDSAQFDNLAAEGYNRIPVHREVLADLDTPLSVYAKLADGPNAFLLESVQGGETWGRYSIIGLPCRRRYELRDDVLAVFDHGRQVSSQPSQDPLTDVQQLLDAIRSPEIPGLPGISGGLVGFMAFETVRFSEPRAVTRSKRDELETPEMVFLEANELAVFDNLAGRLYFIVNADPAQPDAYAQAERRLDQLIHRLRGGGAGYAQVLQGATLSESDYHFGFEQADFEAAVARCKEYILAGDIFQVVLSQRMSVPFRARPMDVYRALRALNPSPYMYFLDLGDHQVVGASPEVLVRVEDGQAMLRPIAGTRPRGKTPAEDRALEKELLADPKERAEHLMLIDLGRNDLGRVARTGTVNLTDTMVVERYSHVMHIVSEVTGELQPGLTAVDAVRAAFPAGTLSGAPKIRALEIIDELEPVRRNLYGGAVGYFSWQGNADFAIAIRTAVIKDGQLHVQAGAGIVADSDPATEWEETMNKGRALINAVAHASEGL